MAKWVGIRLKGFRELAEKLGSVEAACLVVSVPMRNSLTRLRASMKAYPKKPVGLEQKFKTLRQRRYFFWALKHGIIQVPYRRTGTLGRRWTSRIEANGRRGILGNNTLYAPYVQDAERQNHVLGYWTNTDQAVIEKHRATILAEFEQHIKAAMK